MAKVADRVRETTTTTGTGAYSMGGAATGFRTFSSAFSTGDTVYYCVEDGTNWETGIGTLTTGTPWTMARTTVLASSNSGSAVNWGAGTKNVFCTPVADQLSKAALTDVANSFTKPQRPSVSAEITPSSNTITLDLTSYNIFPINLNASITTMNLTGTLSSLIGNQYRVDIRFNGGSAITWNANVKFAAGTAPELTGTSGKIDSITFEVMSNDGGTTCYLYEVGRTQNM